ncbi:hypothetical protein [Rhodopila sp.]|uniref:hypothetical protein n=1 Tax=Rhodopila sp. TaxID=2480087 RepID=UPI003D0B30F0
MAELRLLILNFREMAHFGDDPWLQASLLEVANDIEMEIRTIDAAASTELREQRL